MRCSSFQPDVAWLRKFRRQLMRWFQQHQRQLPWRQTTDLYAIWISEIMLQQTQVATVIPYFERFLEQFPSVTALADAEEAEVMRCWEGLGYYRRARQLHAAAKQIVSEHGGRFPQDFDAVFALPGIGRYTAGAILSIGLDQRLPIVEANTVRLYSRLMMMRDDPRKSDGQRRLWEFAEQLLPKRGGGHGQLNQALMELGSTICTPKSPACGVCPAKSLCPTRQHGLQQEIPLPAKRTVYEDVTEAAVVMTRHGRVLLRQCAEGERWAGLWDFIRFEVPATGGKDAQPSEANLQAGVQRLCGVDAQDFEPAATLKHGVTRYRITLHVYKSTWPGGPVKKSTNKTAKSTSVLKWVEHQQLDTVPLSVTGRKISELLQSSSGADTG